jgi:putative nucleotidyltransferase with HDIG domain
LRTIDSTISASTNLRLALRTILAEITTQLQVDAADVLLLNPHLQTLEYAAGRGFRTKGIERSRLRLGEGHAGRAALERKVITVHAQEIQETFLRAPLLGGEDFVCYYGVPLIAKGQVKGVLEVFCRRHLERDEEWLDYMQALAGQAALAVDNAVLFDDLQRANVELAMAYDATLEGWSRALDLRDKETEGHTQRVTEITERLARALGMSDNELVHIRRGALLHDIGKMGIPDNILNKPGPLTGGEWEIMRQHPIHAYDLLSSISFLRPALDIPYCHHEKWDGTGYPRGLKGEEIPLAARIFALVDVWDALRSDRPYRQAWSDEKALEYIRSQSGAHFDPHVVELFLQLIKE